MSTTPAHPLSPTRRWRVIEQGQGTYRIADDLAEPTAPTTWPTQTEAQSHADRLNRREQLADAAPALLDELRKLEWCATAETCDREGTPTQVHVCPACGGWKPIHQSTCTLAAAIAIADAAG